MKNQTLTLFQSFKIQHSTCQVSLMFFLTNCSRLKAFPLILIGLGFVIFRTSSKHFSMVKSMSNSFGSKLQSSLEASCRSTFVESVFRNRG